MALLTRIAGAVGAENNVREIKTKSLKIRGKTIIIENTIYSIPNISAIEVVKKSLHKPFPWFTALLGWISLYLLWRLRGPVIVLVIVVLGFVSFRLYEYVQSKATNLYELLLVMNSGILGSAAIVFYDEAFLKKVAFFIYDIMNDDDFKNATINLDQKQIHVTGSTGVSVVTGDVYGSIAQSIQ